jgi:nucleotide-binding universal stress UspA family protein
MSYKTILVHVDETQCTKQRIRLASQIAKLHDAHVIGIGMTGISHFIYQNARVTYSNPNLSMHLDYLRQMTDQALAQFEPAMKEAQISSYEQRIVDDDAAAGFCLHGRYSDLLVIGQHDPEHISAAIMSDFPEDVVLHASRPVLIVPYVGTFETVGKRVLISWDASKEATRAITCALPLLKRAELVQIAVFNAENNSELHGEEPGADIALYLARHGIKVEISQHHTHLDPVSHSKLDVGNALLSLANDYGSDLLVMGGYGHSRFRETILGGVTRTILETMTLPVLMSH